MTDTLTRKSPDIEKELDPLPRMGSGYFTEEVCTTEENKTDTPCLVKRGSEMAPEKKGGIKVTLMDGGLSTVEAYDTLHAMDKIPYDDDPVDCANEELSNYGD